MNNKLNIIKETEENTNFRKVIQTNKTSQLVVMNIKPGGEIGEEVHAQTEQTLFFHSGSGRGEINGESFELHPGDVVTVEPGIRHNFINTGDESLKIYTIYWPPHHIDGRIQETKADADADEEDEVFGKEMEAKYGVK